MRKIKENEKKNFFKLNILYRYGMCLWNIGIIMKRLGRRTL